MSGGSAPKARPRAVALSIAGSDSSGGAGAQADLLTFAALGVHGACCLTAVTAQSTVGVDSSWPVPPRQVRAQLDAVCRDLHPEVAKTGMLATGGAVVAVAEAAERYGLALVVDPVLVSSSGTALLDEVGVEKLSSELLPRARLLTPNVAEAELLCGVKIAGPDDAELAGRALLRLGPEAVLVKGGHLVAPAEEGGRPGKVIDILVTAEGVIRLERPALFSEGRPLSAHGTGCVLSAAICALLARDPGRPLPDVCAAAGRFVAGALECAQALGEGARLLDPLAGRPAERRARQIPSPAQEPAAASAQDRKFMGRALELAREAAEAGDVPVGAVVVKDGRIVAEAGNAREQDQDPSAHAELLALRRAAEALGTWRLTGCTLYVTLEPCFMCAGALVNARLDRVVFGARDEKAGAVQSLAAVCTDPRLNHRLAVSAGVCEEEASALLRAFFDAKRP